MPAQGFVKLPRKNNADIGSEVRRLLSLEPVKTACIICVKKFGCLGYKFVSMLAVTLLFPWKNVRAVDALLVLLTVVNHYVTLA